MGTTLKERLEIAMRGPPRVRAVDLARACSVKPPSVSDWLTGKTKRLEGANLLNAARFLRVNPDWLATGRGPRDLSQSAAFSVRETESHYLEPSPAILHEVLTLLFFDEQMGGAYALQPKADRIADLYRRVAAGGGKLTDADNAAFVKEVQARTKGRVNVDTTVPAARRRTNNIR